MIVIGFYEKVVAVFKDKDEAITKIRKDFPNAVIVDDCLSLGKLHNKDPDTSNQYSRQQVHLYVEEISEDSYTEFVNEFKNHEDVNAYKYQIKYLNPNMPFGIGSCFFKSLEEITQWALDRGFLQVGKGYKPKIKDEKCLDELLHLHSHPDKGILLRWMPSTVDLSVEEMRKQCNALSVTKPYPELKT